jgi:hypothetical protein
MEICLDNQCPQEWLHPGNGFGFLVLSSFSSRPAHATGGQDQLAIDRGSNGRPAKSCEACHPCRRVLPGHGPNVSRVPLECGLELTLAVSRVPHFPEEDSKLRATCLEVRRGGNCPNSLEVLQQLLRHSSTTEATLVRPHLVSVLPATDSPASSRIRSSFGHDTLVDFQHCLYREGHMEPASSYIIQSRATDTRTIVNHSDLPDMTVRELTQVADRFKAGTAGCEVEEETLWHFEGRLPETTIECVRYLRRVLPRCRISVEVEKPNREGLRELAEQADIVFYSRAWAEVSQPSRVSWIILSSFGGALAQVRLNTAHS